MRLPAARRRRQLLDVARDVFAARGFHSTSMDDLAETAGVTKPVLYQHFSSKRELYVELLEDVGSALLAEIAAATGRVTGGRARVEAGFAAYFRYVSANQSAFRLLFGASVRNDEQFAAVAERVVSDIAATIATLIEVDTSDEQRLVLAHAIVGIAESTSRRSLQSEQPGAPDAQTANGATPDPETLARWTAELAWYGLRGIRTEPR